MPAARLHGGQLFGEAFAERAHDVALRHLAKRLAEQEGIADRGRVRAAIRADKGCGDLLGVPFQCAAAPGRAEKDMLERQPVLGAKPLRIGCQIGRELFVAWLRGSHVLGEKFHLLPHAPANEEIVAVQARRLAFAIENLVANLVLDEALQFLLGRRTPPGPREPVCEVGHALGRNDDLRGRLGVLLADQTEETEQRRPEHEEMQQRLPQQSSFTACTRSATCRRARSSSSGLRGAS